MSYKIRCILCKYDVFYTPRLELVRGIKKIRVKHQSKHRSKEADCVPLDKPVPAADKVDKKTSR